MVSAECTAFTDSLYRCVKVKRVYRDYLFNTDTLKHLCDIYLVNYLSHKVVVKTGVRLMTCHCRCGIIKHAENHICVIMYRIYNARDARCKERGITDKSEAYAVTVRMVKALCHSDARTHTKTGINHIKRHCFGFVGDSTFFASGITGVVNAVHNNAENHICVLDNSTTAMTGHQSQRCD